MDLSRGSGRGRKRNGFLLNTVTTAIAGTFDKVTVQQGLSQACDSERSEAVTQPAEQARPGLPSLTISEASSRAENV